jgi:hypothetical protein
MPLLLLFLTANSRSLKAGSAFGDGTAAPVGYMHLNCLTSPQTAFP